MKFYITKYAVAKGIIELDSSEMSTIRTENGRLTYYDKEQWPVSYAAGEWYTERSFAVSDAERRRDRKIESLKKQLEKLEKMRFE